MTERLLSNITHSANSQNAIFHSHSINDAPLVIESAEEEPYTIKCICDYSDDDGNTIYCEKCDTWQHIECFYPGRVDDASREEFDHSCADCKPRPLDRRNATERQRQQRQNKSVNNFGDKKIKRLPSKGQKKKSKPLELQGSSFQVQDSQRNVLQEIQPSAKKSKANRSSLSSINNQNKKSPPYSSRSENAQPPSPVQTPPDLPTNFQVHGYSDNFLSLYNQGCVQSTCTNSFASLSVSNAMTDWLRDQSRLYQDAGVRDKEDVFLNLKVSVDSLKWPELRIETKEDNFQDTTLHWQYLITPRQLPQPGRIVELNGLVGFQKDYCNDPENHWSESAHPRPFVFFHPRLPLCIDTRREGSIGRYVRRSCRSNTNLETFIANGTEYHFWLTSEQPLSANEQITISWDFRFPPQYRARFLHLLNLVDEYNTPLDGSDITHEEYEQLTQTIHLVLSDHGGCACDLGNDCAFVRFHRNYLRSSHLQMGETKLKKARKSKLLQSSPTGTESAINILAVNENQHENYDEDDNKSISGSARSKPQSRDLTPANVNGDVNGILTEPSDREKRKLAMLEDSFRRMEQGQPPRKKKRPSGNISTHSLPSQTITKQKQRSIVASGTPTAQTSTLNNNLRSRYPDASTLSQHPRSPSRNSSPSELMRPPTSSTFKLDSLTYPFPQFPPTPKLSYKNSSTQTDQIKNAWWQETRPKKRKPIVTLARRLLLNRYRKDHEHPPKELEVPADSIEPSLPLTNLKQDTDFPASETSAISDASSVVKKSSSSIEPPSTHDANSVDSLSPATVFHTPKNPSECSNQNNCAPPNSDDSSLDATSKLQISDLPSKLSLTDSYGPQPSSNLPFTVIGTASLSLGSVNHIPQAIINSTSQQPSPLKPTKKLSLSDYKAARMKKTDSTIVSQKIPVGESSSPEFKHATLKTSSIMAIHDLKTSVNLDGQVKIGASSAEKSSLNSLESLEPVSTSSRG